MQINPTPHGDHYKYEDGCFAFSILPPPHRNVILYLNQTYYGFSSQRSVEDWLDLLTVEHRREVLYYLDLLL